jgi:hypothetical protein
MSRLGSATPIPAVGFAVWVETLVKLGRTGDGRSARVS